MAVAEDYPVTVSIGPRLFRHGNKPVEPELIWVYNEFQLGHVFSDMEMQQNQPDERVATQVSIGPRLFRHGNLISCILWGYQSLRSFNWATSFQTWKWPRCIAMGRLSATFQLGHVFSDMEMLVDDARLWYNLASVSIGPRLFRHGNSGNLSSSTALGKNPRYEQSVNYTITLIAFNHL